MGCGKSKNDVIEANNINAPVEFKEFQDNSKPDVIRKGINDLYKILATRRDAMKPLLAEKYGLNALVEEERALLIERLGVKDALLKTRDPLLAQIWERDAIEINGAFQKYATDKATLVRILCARPKWQIALISSVYEKKYGMTLLEHCVNDLTTLLGKILSGSGTGLSKLLIYRIMDQPARDAALMRDFSDGMSLNDEDLLEILCSRSNNELKNAIDTYATEYGKSLEEIIKLKASYKNYREFLLQILECNKDEYNRPLDAQVASMYANELYTATQSKTIGIDPAPFIRILSKINHQQFESINEQYPKQQLMQDIKNKLGGDFQQAVVTRCSDKYEYLAGRIEKAIKGFSPDTECICRILGCISRPECLKLKEAFNRLYHRSTGKTLENHIKSILKSQANYQLACLTLLSEDMSLTPLGTDKEISEIEFDIDSEAERAKEAAISNYNKDDTIAKGEIIIQTKQKSKNKNDDNNGNNDEMNDDISDEERALDFFWDPKQGIFITSTSKLQAKYHQCELAVKAATSLGERLGDEITAIKDIYFSILKHRHETDVWNRNLNRDIANVKLFMEGRDRLTISNKK
eukprot:gene11047-14832_t